MLTSYLNSNKITSCKHSQVHRPSYLVMKFIFLLFLFGNDKLCISMCKYTHFHKPMSTYEPLFWYEVTAIYITDCKDSYVDKPISHCTKRIFC